MLKRPRWPFVVAFLVGVLVAGAILWSLGFIPTKAPYCYADEGGDKECATYNIALVALWQIGKGLNWISPAITAAATFAIALLTSRLWRINRSQLLHSREVERAYMSGGGVWESILVNQQINSGQIIAVPQYTNNFELHINNHGKTPGRLLEIAVEFCDTSAIPSRPIYNRVFNPDFIGPDTKSRRYGTFGVPPNFSNPVVYGRLWYRDIFDGRIHSSGFIQALDRNPRNSRLIEPPHRDYTDWD